MVDGLNTLSVFASPLATALLHALWQCALLAAVAAMSLQLLHRHSAALRHSVGMGFLLAMAGAPAWTFLQSFHTPMLEAHSSMAPMGTAPDVGAAAGVFLPSADGWGALLCALWLAGVTFMLLRHLGGLWWIRSLERRAWQRLPSDWQERFDALQGAMGVTRTVLVRVADAVVAPFTARLVRPVIWVPMSLLTQLPREQVEALLAHELAHIHRLDWLWNGLQCAIEALLFFHPGMWWLSRRIRAEREHACDTLAANACGNAVSLAEALAALARERHPGPHLLLAANGGSLMSRIEHLLIETPPPARPLAPACLVALATVGVVFAAPFASRYANASQGNPQSAIGQSATRFDEVGVPEILAPISTLEEVQRVTKRAERAEWDGARAVQKDQQVARVREEVARVAEQTSRLREDSARIAEQASRVREEAAREAEQASRLREDSARAAEQETRVDAATQVLVRLVSADPRVADTIGSPVAVTADGFTGRIGRDDRPGTFGIMDLAFTLTGPKGSARIQASAVGMQADQQWRLTGLEMSDVTRRE